MKSKIFLIVLAAVFTVGCGNLSPLNSNRIRNENGKIDDIKSNQNGVMAEFGKLKQDAQIMASQLKEIQSGLVNLNAILSKNENSGVQILQGDGALFMVFSLATIGMILWYRNRAVKSEKTLSILTKEVMILNDATLNEKILKEADKNGMGKQMLSMMDKSKY